METPHSLCYKCKGTRLKPCKIKDLEKKIPCTVCCRDDSKKRFCGVGKEKPLLRLFKEKPGFKNNMRPLYHVCT
jgi:hypothetical protein